MAAVLVDLFKGEEEEFVCPRNWKGYLGYNPIEWNWRRQVEGINCPSPEPEDHSRDDDPGFHEDPEVSIDFEDGVFFQESLDGSKVAITADHPGLLPSSIVSSKKTPSQTGHSPRAAPGILNSTPKGRRTSRETPTGAMPTPANQGISKQRAATEATPVTSSGKRKKVPPHPSEDIEGVSGRGRRFLVRAMVNAGNPLTHQPMEDFGDVSVTNSEVESVMNHRRRKESLRHAA